jgi:hypothetical protein
MTATSDRPDLRRLMAIADRYARKLVAGAAPPPRVLLLERGGELDVVMLDGPARDAAASVRRLLERHRATSAALMVELRGLPNGPVEGAFCILGETVEGAMEERRYRMRPCGRGRRLTPLAGGAFEVEGLLRPLFPAHPRPRTPETAPCAASGEASTARDRSSRSG